MSTEKTSQSSQHPIAAMYQYSVLDPMIEVARAISHDFVRRPRRYRAVPENVTVILEGFRIRTGSNPEWPSATQRADLFRSLFGAAFSTTSSDLRSAACAFTERGGERNTEPLEDRVRDAALAFRAHLKAIEGRVALVANSETGPVFRSAIEVFQSREVAGVFGLPPLPGGNWPFSGALNVDDASSDGAFQIEEIQRALGLFDIRQTMTQHLFLLLQRVANYGAMTIAKALEDAAAWNRAGWVPAMVRSAYGWDKASQSALSYIEDKEKGLQPRVVSQLVLDDEDLKSMPTEEETKGSGAQIAMIGGGGLNLNNTCNTGITRICDNPMHMASTIVSSCHTGVTYYCETGPTCTSGITWKCDKWLVADTRWGLANFVDFENVRN